MPHGVRVRVSPLVFSITLIKASFNTGIEQHVGALLIASPKILEPSFYRSVLLICDVSDHGVVALIVNKIIDNGQISLENNQWNRNQDIFLGGYVEPSALSVLHNGLDMIPNSLHIVGDWSIGGDINSIRSASELNNPQFKHFFFIGYTGWTHEKLKEEIAASYWLVDYFNEDIFNWNISEIWKNSILSLGSQYQILSHFPENPFSN